MVHKSLILFFSVILFCTSSIAQESSKKYGTKAFQKFYESVDDDFNTNNLKSAQKKIDRYSSANLSTLDCNQKALLYNLQGSIYAAKYDDKNAIRILQDSSLYYWNQCDYKSEYHYANAVFNIGVAYYYLNDFDSTTLNLKYATTLWSKIHDLDKSWLAKKLLFNASIYSIMGDGYNSELIYDRVENLLPELKDKELEAVFHKRKCLHLFNIGRFKEAIEFGKLSNSYFETDEKQYYPDLIVNHNNMANCYIDLEAYNQSTIHLDNIERLFNKYGKNEDYEKYLNDRSINLKRKGKYEESKKIINAKIDLLLDQSQIDIKALAFAYENKADILIEEGQLDDALELYLKARDLYVPDNSNYNSILKEKYQPFLFPLNLVGCLSQIAKTKNLQFESTNKLEYLNEAAEIYDQINSIFKNNRFTTYNEVKKSIASDRVKRLYQEAVKTYISLYRNTNDEKYLEESYKYASVNKSLLQKEKIRSNKIFNQFLPDSLTKKESVLTSNINKTYKALQVAENPLKRDSLYSRLSQFQQEYEDYIRILESKYPAFHSEIYAPTNPLTLSEVQKNLSTGEVLLDYYFGSHSLYCFSVKKRNIEIQNMMDLPKLTTQIEEAREFVENNSSGDNSILEELYKELVQPYVGRSTKSISIIRDEELLKLPFEAFRTGDKYLIEQYPVSYLFSNTDLIKQANKKENVNNYVGFGSAYSETLNETLSDNVSSDFLPLANLSKAPEEINNSNSIWNGQSFINKNATKKNFLENVESTSILHLAVHGIINHKYPDKSALIFDDRYKESVLRLNEIYHLNLNSDLVILSSCDSGSGKIYKAEGTQSLARGFAIAGSSSVVSSLWAAYDDPTSKIISSFNKNLSEGYNKSVALQKAKVEYLKNAFPTFRSPKYWSNLILLGDTTSIVESRPKWIIPAAVVGVLGFLVVGVLGYRRKKELF